MVTHLNKKNKPQIVDISKKNNTSRTAKAEGKIFFSKSSFNKIQKLKTKKGEITSIAIIAGIMGAKKTSELIPLCHNIDIENINIEIIAKPKIYALQVTSIVKSKGKTGVEMEALTAISLACLTIYDMCKSVDKRIEISNIKLLSKKGGKSDFISE